MISSSLVQCDRNLLISCNNFIITTLFGRKGLECDRRCQWASLRTCLNVHNYTIIIFYIVALQKSFRYLFIFVIRLLFMLFFIQMIEALRRDGTDFLDIRIVRHRSGKRESFIATSSLLVELLSF